MVNRMIVDENIFFSLPNNIFADYLHLLLDVYRNFANQWNVNF